MGLKKVVYSPETSRQLSHSMRTQGSFVTEKVLATTISHFITGTRDVLSNLEQKTKDARLLRGNSDHRTRSKNPVTLGSVNDETARIRDGLYTEMTQDFERLEEYTTGLGAAVGLLADYLCYGIHGENDQSGRNQDPVLHFSPKARYNQETGKIEYQIGQGNFAPLKGHVEIESVRTTIGKDRVSQSLLELKIAGAALEASIDPKALIDVKTVQEYPCDQHSEAMDAIQAIEGNLGYLGKVLPKNLARIVKKSTPSRTTQILQNYTDSTTTPAYAKTGAALGIAGGLASLAVGIPQIIHCIKTRSLDLMYTPEEFSSNLPGNLALFFTWAVVGLATYAFLTVGGTYGTQLVRDTRNSIRNKTELVKI